MNLKSQIRHGWIAAIVLIVLTPAAAIACTCAVIPPYRCETEWKRGEAIFLGKVRGASRSEVIDLGFGQHIENFQFKVPISNNPP